MSKPTIVCCPGVWEGPTVFDPVKSRLEQRGYKVVVATLKSTGTKAPCDITMLDDIQGIRNVVETVVNNGDHVVFVMHSLGGALGSAAIEGLNTKAREEKGQKGGVDRLVYLAAGLCPEDFKHDWPPFAKKEAGTVVLPDIVNNAFNGIDRGIAEKEAANWRPQHSGDNYHAVMPYYAFKDIPSDFLIFTEDKCLPEALVVTMAEMANSKISRIAAPHVGMYKEPDFITDFIVKAAEECSR